MVLAGEVPKDSTGSTTVTSDVGAGIGSVVGAQPGGIEQNPGEANEASRETGGKSTGDVPAAVAEEVDAMLIRVGDKLKGLGGEGGPDGERAAADSLHIGTVEWTLRAFLTRFFGIVLEVPSVKRCGPWVHCSHLAGRVKEAAAGNYIGWEICPVLLHQLVLWPSLGHLPAFRC